MSKKRRLIVFSLLFVLVYSSYFIVRTYAKYSSKVVSSGSTAVAKWELYLEEDEGEQSINLAPGGAASNYLMKVTSKSEISSYYSIKISNLSSGVTASIDGGSYITPTDGIIIFNNCGQFNASSNDLENTHTISFRADIGSEMVSNREIDIDVIAEQNNINN